MQLAEEMASRRQVSPAALGQHKKAVADVTHVLVDKNLFISWCAKNGIPTPKTITVKKGGKLPSFHYQYPVMVKESSGSRHVLCHSRADIETKSRSFKEGYQVQEHLLAFDFYRLVRDHVGTQVTKKVLREGREVHEEVTDARLLRQIIGATRRLVYSTSLLGVAHLSLTVAVRQETTYVISCRPST